MDGQLKTLIDLQGKDTRIAALEDEAPRLPREIARFDAAKKEQRTREKDLESVQAKRSKTEARLYEVKTNKEYSAVLAEIEDIKQEKGRVEEEILVLMESQERVAADIKDAEGRLKTREAQGKQEEAAFQEKLRAVDADLALVPTHPPQP